MKTLIHNYKFILLICVFSLSPSLFAAATPVPAASVWSYTAFGEGIGLSGIATGSVNGKLELYLGGSSTTFGGNGYWYALRWNSADKRFDTVYASPSIAEGILAIRKGDPLVSPGKEILVAGNNGSIRIYTQFGKKLVKSFKLSGTNISALELKDMDGDGFDDIAAITDGGLSVYSGNGQKLWELPAISGSALAIGQMDSDNSLEIAATDGNIVDVATKTVQWKRAQGFGVRLQSADIDNDGMEELIAAEGWQFVWAFDVDKKLPKWSITTPQDIGAIKVADVDKDGVQELLVGDGQWGAVYAINTVTKQKEWTIGNPEHGVTNIAFGDVNNDGKNEIFWGAGATSTGSDFLYVGDYTKSSILWQNQHLDGPFLKPAVGDIDGDGKPELVTATFSSDAGYKSGRILVFDGYTLALKGMSEPIADSFGWTGIHDLKLRDVTWHPGKEIVIASDWLYDGLIEVYSFKLGNFTKVWTNSLKPSGSPFYSVDMADLDNNGQRELIIGGGREHTGADGVFVYLYDLKLKTESWRSFQIGDYWGNIPNVTVGDLDGDGDLDFGGLASNGEFSIFDGPTKDPLALFTTNGKLLQTILRTGKPASLIVDDQLGGVDWFEYQSSTAAFEIAKHQKIDVNALTGFKFRNASNVWYGLNGVLKNKNLATGNVISRTLNYGSGLGKDIVFLAGTKYGDLAVTGGNYGIFGFTAGSLK